VKICHLFVLFLLSVPTLFFLIFIHTLPFFSQRSCVCFFSFLINLLFDPVDIMIQNNFVSINV
jgi:hypothetical protein